MASTTSAPPEPSAHGPDEIALARFMAEAGRILGESLDFEVTLRRVAELVVPRIADWCAIELLTEDGRLEELALTHADPAKIALIEEIRRRYPADPDRETGSYVVVRTRAPTVVSEVTPEMVRAVAADEEQADLLARLELRSYMCVPLLATGRIVGTLTLATDGSGRHFAPADVTAAEDLARQAASAIQNAQAYRAADRFRRILDAVHEAVFVIAPTDGRVRDVNRGAVELLGLDRPAIIGRRIWDFAADVGPATARELVRPLLDGHLDARTVEAVMADPARGDGGRPVEVLIQRLEIPGEGPGLVAIARDMRDRVEAQARLERLAEAEHARAAELNAVIRAMGDGVVVCDDTGRITLANPSARELFRDVVVLSYADILDQLHDPEGRAPGLGRLDEPVTLPTRLRPVRWIEVATYPVEAATPAGATGADVTSAVGEAGAGAGAETIVVLRDVTAARERDAIRETFIGVLSHELRTPVTTIYGGARILSRADSTLDDSTRQSIFDDIAAESERLQRLVEDVVALNRFGEQGGDVGQEPVLLQRLVPAVVQSEGARWPGMRFASSIPPGLPTVVADATYVEQVVRNLLSNAAKYGGPGAAVDVTLEAGDGEVTVRILDDGPGIDPDEADRLFELFYRSPSTASTTAGAGIGLFVCARLVAAMGGRIWARRRDPAGSEFGFALRVMADA